jgi:peptidoglycan/xylan/chitin deacetylase (PgdA/CDA1 family)
LKINRQLQALLLAAVLLAGSALAAPGCSPGDQAAGQPFTNEVGALTQKAQSGDGGETPAFNELRLPDPLPSPALAARVPVLMYHHVGETPPGADDIRAGLTVSEDKFREQMDYLASNGYHPVSEADLFKALFYGDELPPHAVMLTFDDGYEDNYRVAAPVLESHGFPATFFIITGSVGGGERMDWDQIRELDRKGMDIGSHTVSHPDLSIISLADAKEELQQSQKDIAEKLGHPVYWLSYPAGAYDPDVLALARESGYLLAVTTDPGEHHSSDAPLEIQRYRIRSDTGIGEFAELVK